MQIQAIWDFLEASLFLDSYHEYDPSPVFNIYTETNPDLEHLDAAQIRRSNLYNYLSSFLERPSILIVGEAPGWRGCRFSGVPFTSESQLYSAKFPFKGGRQICNFNVF